MSLAGRIFCVLLAVGPFLGLPAGGAETFCAGPLASQFRLTLEPGLREEAFGPFLYHEAAPPRDLAAMPPLWSCTRDPDVGSMEVDLLYPLLTYDRFGEEYRVQFLQILSFSGGRVSQTETNLHRFTLFPVYFQQSSPIPEQNYTAVFPFYGHLENRFFRDDIDFAFWPVYVKTKRNARVAAASPPEETQVWPYRWFEPPRGEITTYNFLAPFFHVRTGPGLRGWQAWPLLGMEHQSTALGTNQWGDPLLQEGHDRMFALWPVFLEQHNGLGTTNAEHQLSVLPLFSSLRSPARDSTTAPWPIGLTLTVDRGRRYREWGLPWPLVVFARGEGKTTSRIWPFFSQSHNEFLESDFYLWPLYKYNRVQAPPLDRVRTRLLFYLYSDVTEKNTETGHAKRRVDAWPCFTYQRDWAGNESWHTFSVLEPFLPASKSIERNYSQLWSVVRAERNALTGAHSESLLWNTYRHESTTTNRQSSLLFGLIQWRVGPDGRKARWFYLPGEIAY
jgi:hypothetical protein